MYERSYDISQITKKKRAERMMDDESAWKKKLLTSLCGFKSLKKKR